MLPRTREGKNVTPCELEVERRDTEGSPGKLSQGCDAADDLELMGTFGRRFVGALHEPPKPLGDPEDSELVTVPLWITEGGNPPAEFFREHGPTMFGMPWW